MTGPLSILAYHAHRQFQNISMAVVGTCFEPNRDIALVTGGCNGLGKEIVRQFAATGAKVVVLDLLVPQEKEDNVAYFQCDVSNRLQILDCQRQIVGSIGTVTILVNNAGIATGKSVLELSYGEIETTVKVNLLSGFYTIKAFLPDMLKIKRGYIVTVASVLGYMSPARLSAYGASKSGLIALHESLTYELGAPSLNLTGVKTLLICPGQLKTRMFNSVRTPSQLLAPELDPDFVARQLVKSVLLGRRGEIKLPFYGNFLPVMRAVPWPIVEAARYFSGIDASIKTIVDAAYTVASLANEMQVPPSRAATC